MGSLPLELGPGVSQDRFLPIYRPDQWVICTETVQMIAMSYLLAIESGSCHWEYVSTPTNQT